MKILYLRQPYEEGIFYNGCDIISFYQLVTKGTVDIHRIYFGHELKKAKLILQTLSVTSFKANKLWLEVLKMKKNSYKNQPHRFDDKSLYNFMAQATGIEKLSNRGLNKLSKVKNDPYSFYMFYLEYYLT